MAAVPGPRGLPLTGNLFAVGHDVLGFLERTRAPMATSCGCESPGCRSTWRAARRRPDTFFSSGGRTTKRRRGRALEIRHIAGASLLTANGDDWHGKRHVLQPAFKATAIARYHEVMRTATGEADALAPRAACGRPGRHGARDDAPDLPHRQRRDARRGSRRLGHRRRRRDAGDATPRRHPPADASGPVVMADALQPPLPARTAAAAWCGRCHHRAAPGAESRASRSARRDDRGGGGAARRTGRCLAPRRNRDTAARRARDDGERPDLDMAPAVAAPRRAGAGLPGGWYRRRSRGQPVPAPGAAREHAPLSADLAGGATVARCRRHRRSFDSGRGQRRRGDLGCCIGIPTIGWIPSVSIRTASRTASITGGRETTTCRSDWGHAPAWGWRLRCTRR